eukprot:Em0023g500a
MDEDMEQEANALADEAIKKMEAEKPPAEWGEDISPSHDGGVCKKILTEGKGYAKAPKGSEVSVHYTGKLLDGTVFDSSRDRGELFKFKLGKGSVIKGWDIGVATMKKGETCLLTCRSEYAYGKAGSPPKIPADATLQFEVELFEWQAEDITNDGGVLKTELAEGEGWAKPSDGAAVTVQLVGKYNGKVFEDREVTFDYGEGSEAGVISGVERALKDMKLKEKVHLTVKPQYAFGAEGNKVFSIPPNATVEYDVSLTSFQKAKQTWDYTTAEEKKADAEKLKEKGTNYFKSSKFGLAVKLYERASELVKKSSTPKDDEEAVFKETRLALFLNLAACYLKLNDATKALQQCDEALKLDGTKVKAYFRKGQACQQLQEYEEAIEAFNEVLRLEPDNREAQAQLKQSRNMRKALVDKEKKMYASMFKKLLTEDKSANQTPSQTGSVSA